MHEMQHKHPRHKLSTHNCACGLHILVHNKYIYIPRLNHLFMFVLVVNLYTFCSQRSTRSERGCSDVGRPEKNVVILTPSKWTSGLTGTKKERLPLLRC